MEETPWSLQYAITISRRVFSSEIECVCVAKYRTIHDTIASAGSEVEGISARRTLSSSLFGMVGKWIIKDGNKRYESKEIVKRTTPKWETFELILHIKSKVSVSKFSHYIKHKILSIHYQKRSRSTFLRYDSGNTFLHNPVNLTVTLLLIWMYMAYQESAILHRNDYIAYS